MNMTRSELAALLRANPQITLADETSLDALLPDPKCQRYPLPALECSAQSQTGSLERPRVLITSRRCGQLLDHDNLVAGAKALLDGLATAGLIAGDGPDQISTEYRQEKVKRRRAQATVVEIIYPDQ